MFYGNKKYMNMQLLNKKETIKINLGMQRPLTDSCGGDFSPVRFN